MEKKPAICSWISELTRNLLTLKEKAFVRFTHERRYTKEEIMQKFYITNHSSYWRIQTSVQKKLKWDIEEFNKFLDKTKKRLDIAKCNEVNQKILKNK